jgi:hypothetical protein
MPGTHTHKHRYVAHFPANDCSNVSNGPVAAGSGEVSIVANANESVDVEVNEGKDNDEFVEENA